MWAFITFNPHRRYPNAAEVVFWHFRVCVRTFSALAHFPNLDKQGVVVIARGDERDDVEEAGG